MARAATDKRQRLVAAAVDQFHCNGYPRTALADVAKAAGVPVGNVFYYFKAKDDLALAVIDEWCSVLSGYFRDLEAEDDAWKRLEAFVRQAQTMREIYVTLGCPLAGLTRDLKRESDRLKTEVSRIYATQYRWLEKEFRRGGFLQEEAEPLSRELMSSYHGAILLAFAQCDASIIDREVERLLRWLRQRRDRLPV